MKVRSRAPLRLGLAGGGSDVPSYANEYGGSVLNATIALYVYCTITSCNNSLFRSIDLQVTESHQPNAGIVNFKLKLHHAVHRVMCARFDTVSKHAIEVTTFSEVPSGSGLGTSSTLVVALLEAYRTFFSLPISQYDLAALAVYIEREFLAQAGGLQDQYAAVFGGLNFIEFTKGGVIVNPLRIRPEIVSILESYLVMFFTGVSRDSAKIITDQTTSVRSRSSGLEAMHRVKSESYAMKDAFLKGNIGDIASVLRRGWDAKKQTSDSVSNERINRTFEIAEHEGALAGKVSGAGGGGFMFFLVAPENRINLSNKLMEFGLSQYLVRFTESGVQSWISS